MKNRFLEKFEPYMHFLSTRRDLTPFPSIIGKLLDTIFDASSPYPVLETGLAASASVTVAVIAVDRKSTMPQRRRNAEIGKIEIVFIGTIPRSSGCPKFITGLPQAYDSQMGPMEDLDPMGWA